MPPPSEKRRLILVSQPSLLSESLEHLLNSLEDVTVVASLPPDDQVVVHLGEYAPDLVFITDDEPAGQQASKVTALLLESHPDLPIIRVRPDRNTLLIYTSQTIPARLADLVDLIRHVPISGTTVPISGTARVS